MLDSDLANYSFGKLHEVFQFTINQITLPRSANSKVLIVGFGAGSIASILRNEKNFKGSITGIEIDPQIIELGKEYFDKGQWNNTKIIIGDALALVPLLNEKFDLIFVDVFVEQEIPFRLRQTTFLANLYQILNDDGQILMNTMINHQNQVIRDNWTDFFKEKGSIQEYKANAENTVFGFQKK